MEFEELDFFKNCLFFLGCYNMSTHPIPAHRIEKIEELLGSVLPLYEKSNKQTTKKIEKVKRFIPTKIPFFKT